MSREQVRERKRERQRGWCLFSVFEMASVAVFNVLLGFFWSVSGFARFLSKQLSSLFDC